ncbi:3-dehydroquinate synthase [Fluviibacter phosphoraccumulans]|uniref:3-dehydroquinate synthase n=1 Tax=Fluviibacter phosphoraccumulans TaxID=1751046 RepID=UPI0024E2062D|nr:3-dehydroquinate synthase [Fluviibacter phosphoraccumulans]
MNTMYQTLTVALDERSYPIHIGCGLLGRAELWRPHLNPKMGAVVITNTTVAPLYLDKVLATLAELGCPAFSVVLPDGEEYKSWETLNTVFDALLENRCERGTTLIALGGGVIGDLVGFAAACYQRGAPFIQVPTTLLSQVDSSVGGKTAINHPLGKNMIGAFYQPKLVLADLDTLDTLPPREMAAGMSEVIKYGLIRDPAFFSWLEQQAAGLMHRDKALLAQAVYQSCAHKAEVVARDEREAGERALLNLGHTFGHAIETGMGYGSWLHGEAVAAGTVMAALLSEQLGWLDQAAIERIKALFRRVGLPVDGPWLAATPLATAQRYLELMRHDKKVSAGILRLVLLQGIGQAVVSADANDAAILQAVQAGLAVAPSVLSVPPTQI